LFNPQYGIEKAVIPAKAEIQFLLLSLQFNPKSEF